MPFRSERTPRLLLVERYGRAHRESRVALGGTRIKDGYCLVRTPQAAPASGSGRRFAVRYAHP